MTLWLPHLSCSTDWGLPPLTPPCTTGIVHAILSLPLAVSGAVSGVAEGGRGVGLLREGLGPLLACHCWEAPGLAALGLLLLLAHLVVVCSRPTQRLGKQPVKGLPLLLLVVLTRGALYGNQSGIILLECHLLFFVFCFLR